MQLKILWYGAHGWIGSMLVNYFRKEHSITTMNILSDLKVSIETEEQVISEIANVQPDRVVCLVGRTRGGDIPNIDYLEQPGKLYENIRDNLCAPLLLANIASRFGIHMTYFGTGCIFDGYTKQFTEDDEPNFFGSSYSTVKGYTDYSMRHLYPRCLNLRIRMPIVAFDHPQNFISKIVRFTKIDSKLNSMTVIDDFIPIIYDMITNQKEGTYNLVNAGAASHDEILQLYKQIVDHDHTWENINTQELSSLLKSKRSNNILSTTKLQKEYYVPTLTDSIERILKNWGSLLC